jgi:hypothetical protein
MMVSVLLKDAIQSLDQTICNCRGQRQQRQQQIATVVYCRGFYHSHLLIHLSFDWNLREISKRAEKYATKYIY